MPFDTAIFLAAMGITTLEVVEAAAVGLALYADSKNPSAFLWVSLGIVVVFAPMFLLGAAIGLLPPVYVHLIGGALLLYFGLRLVKSARRSVLNSRNSRTHSEHFERGMAVTAFSVGAVEAFEAAIVLVGLLPNNFGSTVYGVGVGVLVVVIGTYVLKNHVRRIKQATMKVFVSALLLSFAVFWFGEVFFVLNDLILVPLFLVFALLVFKNANRPSSPMRASQGGGAEQVPS